MKNTASKKRVIDFNADLQVWMRENAEDNSEHISTVILIEFPWRYFLSKPLLSKDISVLRIKEDSQFSSKRLPSFFFAYYAADKSFISQG